MKVLNFGSLNIDYVYKVDHIVQKGETLLSEDRNIFTGGKGLNQSVALGRAGLSVYHAGNIGTGGEFLLDELKSAGVDICHVRILKDIPSGHTVIQNDKDGDNCILLFGGANQAVTKEQVDEVIQEFDPEDWIVLQNEINELGYIIEKAHEQGMKILLNPSPMNDIILKLPLEDVDLFMLNEIEAGQITGVRSEDRDILADTLLKKFPESRFVLTLGSQGSVYIDKDQRIEQDIYKVKTVDTTAAGDTFTGYFLAGILNGKTIQESLDLASKASSITVTGNGAAPSIPTMEKVLASYRK